MPSPSSISPGFSQPWINEAVGTLAWTGTPLRGLLEEVGVGPGAVEVLFTGLDRGLENGVELSYERSLRLEDAMREEVLLAYAAIGKPHSRRYAPSS